MSDWSKAFISRWPENGEHTWVVNIPCSNGGNVRLCYRTEGEAISRTERG